MAFFSPWCYINLNIGLHNDLLSMPTDRLTFCFRGVISDIFVSPWHFSVLSSPLSFMNNLINIQRSCAEAYKSEGHHFLCFFMLYLCLTFLKVLFCPFAFANFCEVVCRGILYQDLCYSCFVCCILHHRDKTDSRV